MKRFTGFTPILIFLVGFLCLVFVLKISYSQLSFGKDNKSVLKNEIQVSSSNTSKLPDSWTSCINDNDNECVYIPHPCCPNWTSGTFNLSVVRSKPVDTSVCQPKPAECISAQPVIPNGKVIRSVCRKSKCKIEFIDKNLFEPVKMGIPCKETKDCPGPAVVCGKDGFCIEGNR